MKILSGIFNSKLNDYKELSENVFVYETDKYCISVCGNVIVDQQTNSGNMIVEVYERYGNVITEHINGLYILAIYDKKNHELSVYHDRTTSPITLYYTYSDETLYFSTSLKKLLLMSKIERKLNENVIETFIVNGFIYGEQTLVENIYKIKSFHCLKVNENGAFQQKVNYCFTEYSEDSALANFRTVLDSAVLKQADGENELNAPLSSGYDSSYIVDVLSKQTDLPINAFSIGGKFGKNELPVVKKNVKCFDRTTLISELTDSSTLQNYPDIVWRLEGNVYEVGLFLQYELNKLVNDNGKHSLICGECADQVMNQYYFTEERNKTDGNESDKYYEFSEYPYVFGSYLILKKNGILANSFDIETKYPYLDDEFIALNKPLAEYNGKKKTVHKENCNACLPKEIIDNISKIGGSTECHSLFENDDEIQHFFRFVEKSDFFKSHKALIKKHSYSEIVKPDLVTILKTKIRNTAYKVMKKETDSAGKYFNDEMKLREYLNYTYLILFSELFLSGKHDYMFSEPGITDSLSNYTIA